MKIRIITDSASDIVNPSTDNLTVLPMKIAFGDEEYLDGVDLSHRQFYEKLIETDTLPVTSMVTPYDFEKAYEASEKNGEIALVITISSKLSGTYNSAKIASNGYENVYVIDSESVCVGQKILVEYSLKLINDGCSLDEILSNINKYKKSIKLIALLDTLEYLIKGGRISKTSGYIGSMLSIKPVITISDGEVKLLGKARGSKNGNNLLNSEILKSGGICFDMPYSLAYSGFDDTIIKKYTEDNKDIWCSHTDKLVINTVGGTIGTHVGPGAIAVAFFAADVD